LVALALVAGATPTAVWAQGAWTLRAASGPGGPVTTAYDSVRGVTVLVSGDQTWEWNGSVWTERGTFTSLAGTDGAMAYDSARGVTIYYMDYGYPTFSNGMFEWDGSVWTPRGGPPEHRPGGAIAYDSGRAVTVLYLGSNANYGGNSDTWEWDGNAWTLRATIGPPPLIGAAMAYDAARGVTVFFGGFDNSGNNPTFASTCGLSDETWEWDGTYWAQLVSSGPSPSPRQFSAMAYDSVRGRVALFGGETRQQVGIQTCVFVALGDTWEWSGTHWTQWVGCGPSPRYQHGMAYDSVRGETVLFGGYIGFAGAGSSETWELSSVPCYANCDGSNCQPILNANDFTCFLNKFAANDPYANCDGSTVPPMLNANDFACFLNKFAAGCT
jgi:hypothetical protein